MLLATDASALALAYLVSVVVRYDSTAAEGRWQSAGAVLIAAVALQWLFGMVSRVYLGRVGVASIEETIALGVVTVVAGVTVASVNALADPYWIARSIPVSATFLGLFLMLTVRAVWRHLTDQIARTAADGARPTVIVGAGHSGHRLAHSMLSRPESGLVPVAFLDDDPWKRKRRHYGVPVLGTLGDLASVVDRTGAQVVVVAIPSASKDVIRPLVDQARELGVTVKVLPSIAESFSTKADVRDVRDVNMRDILGRATIETDVASIAGYVTGKRVLVTGAGGSIGSELCRQLDRCGPPS